MNSWNHERLKLFWITWWFFWCSNWTFLLHHVLHHHLHISNLLHILLPMDVQCSQKVSCLLWKCEYLYLYMLYILTFYLTSVIHWPKNACLCNKKVICLFQGISLLSVCTVIHVILCSSRDTQIVLRSLYEARDS